MEQSETTKWVRLGDYIDVYDRKNTEGKPYPFFGINKDKTFMPTVADTNELDNKKYKVVEKGIFAFNGMHVGRDVALCIALYDKTIPIIVSPAYTTFKVKDEALLSPEFLFMQLSRGEFGRFGWFLCDASVRGGLDWRRFCDIEIPLPSIEVQRELVDTYIGIKAIAEQNEALSQRLSIACHAYIVDCRAKYDAVPLGDYIEQCDERAANNYTVDDVIGISTDKKFIETKANMSGVSLNSYKVVKPLEFAYVADTSRRGDKIALALNNSEKPVLISSIYTAFRCKDFNQLLPKYLLMLLNNTEFDRYARFNSWGSARETFDWSEMCRVKIPLPPIEVQQAIVELFNCADRAKKIAAEARERLKTLCPALVQRAANS